MSAHITFAAGYGLEGRSDDYYAFAVWQPDGTLTLGIPPVYVETKLCEDCHQVHEFEKCPLCGAWIFESYGLIFGGMGVAKICDGETDCPWFYKVCDMGEA